MIVNLRESLNTRDRKSVNGNSKYYDLVNLYESCNLSADNKKTLAKMINNDASDKAIYSFLYECYEGKEDIKEDTVKKDGKWVNKGKEGTHGEFKTKKAADAQRKAMFANGYKGESLKEKLNLNSEGKALKRAIKNIVVDNDNELREFVSAVVEEVISERNSFEESLKESLESEDGWSEEILNIVDPFFVEVEKVAYELRNTVRGAYRFGTTVEDLAQVFRGFSVVSDDIANELDDNQEHLEEDWRTGTFTRDNLTSYRAEMKKRVEGVAFSIKGMKEKHPEYYEIFDNLTAELVDILSSSYMNESLKESISIKEEPHEECVGNNCTDEHDLFPEEKYFTIVVTHSDDGEDEIIDDVTKEIADKYIDDLKRDNDEFFSHAKVLDHNGEVVNSWEYLEEAAKSKKSSSIKDRLKKLIPDLDI